MHGWGGTHPLHWQNWLKKKAIESKKYRVLFPLMPKPSFPILSEWLETLQKKIPSADESLILVGHSLGCPTILRHLEKSPEGQKAGLVVLVAGFARPLGIPEIDDFVEEPFDWKKIKQNAKRFVVVFSDNDPFIPVKESLFLANSLGVKPVIEKNAGHITAPDFGEYPRIWNLIEQNSHTKDKK